MTVILYTTYKFITYKTDRIFDDPVSDENNLGKFLYAVYYTCFEILTVKNSTLKLMYT